jgi:hypothetical protein
VTSAASVGSKCPTCPRAFLGFALGALQRFFVGRWAHRRKISAPRGGNRLAAQRWAAARRGTVHAGTRWVPGQSRHTAGEGRTGRHALSSDEGHEGTRSDIVARRPLRRRHGAMTTASPHPQGVEGMECETLRRFTPASVVPDCSCFLITKASVSAASRGMTPRCAVRGHDDRER